MGSLNKYVNLRISTKWPIWLIWPKVPIFQIPLRDFFQGDFKGRYQGGAGKVPTMLPCRSKAMSALSVTSAHVGNITERRGRSRLG